MMLHKITTSVDYNQWLKSLHTQLNEPTNQTSTKVLNVFSQRIRKRYRKTLGIIVINSPMSLPSLVDMYFLHL